MDALLQFRQCTDAVAMLNGDGECIAANPAAQALAASGDVFEVLAALAFRGTDTLRFEICDSEGNRWFEVDSWPADKGRMLLARDITIRKGKDDVVRALALRIKEFETLLDVLPVGIGIASDPDCRDMQINPAFSSMLAMPPEHNASSTGPVAAQLPFTVYRDGNELTGDQLPMQMAAREARQIRDVELDIVRHDGTTVTELCFASPLFDEQHQVRGSLGVFLDITQRHHWEKSLRESEGRYRFLMEALPQIIWIATREDQILYINNHWGQYTGLTLEQTQQGGWAEVMHPDDLPRAGFTSEADIAALSWKAEYRLLRASDLTWRWHLARAELVRMADGSERWLGTALDIDDRKRAEEENASLLRQTEEALALQRQIESQLLLLVEASSALIASPDSEHILKTILGLASRFLGADAYVVWRKSADSAWTITAKDGLSDSYILPVWEPNRGIPTMPLGPYPVEDVGSSSLFGHRAAFYQSEGIRSLLLVPLQTHVGTGGGIVFYYRTPQRFNERELRVAGGLGNLAAAALGSAGLYQQSQQARLALQKLNTELKRANDDLNQFAYSASHDLQEPLRMVAIYSQRLEREFGEHLGERGSLYARYAVQGAKQMEMLVRDILAYTRAADASDEHIVAVSADEALRKVLANLEAAIQETGAEIEAGPLPEVMVYEIHLVEILQNLVGNALKYRRPGKTCIRISAEPAGSHWQISVSDNGIGIADAYHEQIFGIFKRLHTAAEYPGTGVGLAICQKIVERYGGQIGVESEVGVGSDFRFTLPGG